MSYEKIKQMIDDKEGDYFPFNKEEIRKCESELNLIFAKPFKDFLLEIGSMTVGSFDIYGYSSPESILVDNTKELREIYPNIPKSFIALADDGYGDSWAYDNVSNKVYFLNHEDRLANTPKLSHNTIEQFLEELIENS